MEKNEKALLDELKFFDINNLYQKGSYIDFNFQNFWTQGYIIKARSNNKYDLSFLYHPSDTKNVAEISNNSLAFFGEHSYKNEIDLRNVIFNKELYDNDLKQIFQKFKLKLKKANLDFDFENKEKKKSKNKEKEKEKDKEKDNNEIKKDEKKTDDNNEKLEKKEKKENINENKEEKEKEIQPEKNGNNENKIESENKNTIKTNEEKTNEDNNSKKENEKKEETTDIKTENKPENEPKKEDNETITTASTPKKSPTPNESTPSIDNNSINSKKEKENEKNNSQNNTPESKNKDAINNNISNSLTKVDKNGNSVNISGYYTFQLLGGFLIDCCVLLKNQLLARYFKSFFQELFELCLDTINFIADCVKTNLNKMKVLYNNRKLIIVSQTYAILASYEYVLTNFHEFYQYELSMFEEIDKKFKKFASTSYEILIESQKLNALPFKLLGNLIKFIADGDVNGSINDYDENKVYKVFLSHIENLSENELKTIKNNELMKRKCIYTINMIFGKPKVSYINACYNSYLINCLKCNNLEKRMNALNDISEIIENISKEEIDKNFYDFFIKKNKILDIFFEESVHEEILKRASCIFKYLASFNKLDNEMLDKLIQEQKNDAMKNILCDVISELPSEKKNLTFNHLVNNLNFDEKKTDIEYISRLTQSCLENESYQKLLEQYKKKELKDLYDLEEEEEEANDDLESKDYQNYYGLTLLFDYIIKDFNEKKPFDKNNVNFAIEAFYHAIQFSSCIEAKDLFHFMDLIFENIKSNEKHNSVIQSLILLKKLLDKLYDTNVKEKVIKKINEKYDIISLIVNDLIKYINNLQIDENSKTEESKIYEGIYPHKSNIEERLDIIFIFNRYKQLNIKIDIDNVKKIYNLFKPKKFKMEMQKFLNNITKNLRFIEKETIHSFYKDIITNPEEFDIKNFEDLNALNLIKDLFYKINHDKNTLKGSEKKLRVVSQEIEGFDFLFDILINNKNKFIQRNISKLLCNLCLNLYDYKSDFPQKYWKFYMDKIEGLLVKLDQENDINKLNGIINLIDLIYTNSCNFEGDIPTKDDVHQVDENHELFQIHCDAKVHKDYMIYVGFNDNIYLMRWKCGYYYDIPVNNVVLVDKNKKKYSLINDNEKFFEIFPKSIYSPEVNSKGYVKVNVIQEKDILLTIPGNPKVLIEENENLFKILIKNLSAENKLENDIKQKIYNIIKKMPKKLYIEQNIKAFGSKEKISDEIINKSLNYENIYVLSYFLECFDFYTKFGENNNLEEKIEDINEFLHNFVFEQNGEKIFINLLLNAKIDYDNIFYIQIECITNLINLINFINDYKNPKKLADKNFEYIRENVSIDDLIKNLSELIINILKIKYDEIVYYRSLFIIDVCSLLEKIISFIDNINSQNKTYYLRYLLTNKELFKEIFLYNYMKCKEEKLIEILHTYFIKNIFEDFNLIKIYLEIMFATDIFKYLIENDTNGNYFRMLTSIMQKFNLKNLENKGNKKISNNQEKITGKVQNDNKKDKQNNKDEKNKKTEENNLNKEKKEFKENKEKQEDNDDKGKSEDHNKEKKEDNTKKEKNEDNNKEKTQNINKDTPEDKTKEKVEGDNKEKTQNTNKEKSKDIPEEKTEDKNQEKTENNKSEQIENNNNEKIEDNNLEKIEDKNKEKTENNKNEQIENNNKEKIEIKNKEKTEDINKEKGQDTNKENLEKDQKSIESQQIQEGKEKKEEIDLKVKGEEKNQVNVPTNEKCNTGNLENKENNAIDKKKINNEIVINLKEDNKKELNDLNDSNAENKFIAQFKTIIDLIIEHIKQLCDEDINNNDNNLTLKNEIKSQTSIYSEDFEFKQKHKELLKNNKIAGIITFLQSILNLHKEELLNYFISKVDIIDLFLNKCIISKCNMNSLESKFPLCSRSSGQDSVFHLIIFLLNNLPKENNLYLDIIRKLSKYHKIGFWKTKSLKNWELEISDINKQKYIGLKNLASTCYMNSILQQIFMIPMLRETILSIKNTKPKTVLFELQLLFSALKVYESQYYDPTSFVIVNKLNFYEQMDADEYFGIFIDKIESDIKNLYSNDSENKYKDLFRFFFGIKALDELKFVDCNHKRYNEFFYNNIQLEVKGFNNLDSSMKNYFKTEIMDGENKINCEECKMKRTCHKRQIFKSLPNILVINLKRFEFDYNTMLKSKLNNYFEFPFELDMKEYLIDDHKETNTKYELTGITIHFGFSDYGHYYDLIKASDGKWYKFNDDYVTEFNEKDIPHEAFGEKDNEEDFIKDIEEKDNGQNNAYILIYKKVNFDEDTIDNISKNYICDLASPPYYKFGNINDKIKSIINVKMFKFWTIQSIVSPAYQNFIINLLKYDLAKNTKNKQEEKNNEIFEFGLIYFFNVELRAIFKPKEKTYLSDFVDLIILYIQRDIKKAKFILEEFSNEDVIQEYLISCPTKSGIQSTEKIIYSSFKKILDYISLNQNSNKISADVHEYYSFVFKFINTYVLFIAYNIKSNPIEHVNNIFYQLISLSESFLNYLKDKNIEKWIISFYRDDDDDEDDDEEIYLNSILNEKQFPKLKSEHKILSERKMEFNGTKIPEDENEEEWDKLFNNRGRDISGNMELIKNLYYDLKSAE